MASWTLKLCSAAVLDVVLIHCFLAVLSTEAIGIISHIFYMKVVKLVEMRTFSLRVPGV